MRRGNSRVAACVLGLSLAQAASAQPAAPSSRAAAARPVRATVREYKKTIRTYPYSDPNPIATFGLIYPYFRYDRYTDQAVEREWTVVELENAYLRVAILPEIGGKIWSAVEKSTGRSFIYDNHVVKFRDIAMRGPWTSGGIEANYGIIGHTPNCATPVDYTTHASPDGSASVTIGTLDLLTRTTWRLEIGLPSDAAYFTTRSLWQNASGIEQPYYTWMNTGIKAAGGLEFVYPGTQYLGHNGEVGAWPIHPDNGRNLARYDQNDFGPYKSYHVFGAYTDFFGAYWHDDDFGMGRYARRDQKMGKKIWIWGLSRQGMIWEPLLTDTDGQYVEVQSGRLFNQTAELSTLTPFKHRGFPPFATDSWTEYWFPVKGTQGFVHANDLGALNIQQRADGLDLAFSPLQRLETSVEVFDGDTRVRTVAASFRPLETWRLSLPTPVAPEALRVRIGGDRFEYVGRPTETTLSRPVEAPRDFDWESVYGLSLKAKELIRERAYGDAERAVDECLRKDPHYLPALVDKALLRYRAGDDRAAYLTARHGLSIDTYDPGANYYYGLAAARLGKMVDARDGFDVAAQAVEFRSAALIQSARLAIRERRPGAAEDYASRSLETDRTNLEGRRLLAVARRLNGRVPAARTALAELLALDPLNHGARYELARLAGTAAARATFVQGIRHELPHETFLELAAWYRDLGLDDDARAVLEAAPDQTEVLYWRAYLERGRPDGAPTAALARATDASPQLVFPFRPESVPVFTWAMERGGGWKPAYYLALVVRGLGDVERARRLLAELGTTPDFAPFYAVRAQLSPGTPQALADLRRAADLDPREWRYGRLLVERALAEKDVDDAERLAARYRAADPGNYLIGTLHARTLLRQRRYADALDRLSQLTLLPFEGSTEGRSLHREANLMLALDALDGRRIADAERFISSARQWPENLGAGKPYPEDTDERLEDWLEASVLEARGATEEARALLARIASVRGTRGGVGALVSALALQRLDRPIDPSSTDASTSADPAFAAWSRRVLQGERLPPPATIVSSDELRVFAAWLAGTPR
ncbi:MAG: DUF5107 domain-containing protein [Vicinamibacterales bacterium]